MNRYALLLATFVARRRAALNLTVEAAAHHAGITAEVWRELESGDFVPCYMCELIDQLAHVLDVSLTKLSMVACISEYNQSIDVSRRRSTGTWPTSL